jgi:hypothetical protein
MDFQQSRYYCAPDPLQRTQNCVKFEHFEAPIFSLLEVQLHAGFFFTTLITWVICSSKVPVLDGTWFGGLELLVLILVSKSQIKIMSEFWDKF